MPTYKPVPDKGIAQLEAEGFDPSEYVYDSDTDEVMHKSEAAPLGVMGNLAEVAKGLGRGGLSTLTAPLALAGTTADLIRQATGEYDPKDPSAFTSAAKGIQGIIPPADPRTHWAVSGSGEALGNIGGAIIPALGAARFGPSAAKALGIGLGGMQIGEDTAEQEMARQLREDGKLSPGRTAGKALLSTGIGTAAEGLTGAGKLLRALESPAKGLKGVASRIPGNVLGGGLTEGVQQGSQDYIVEGKVNPENALKAAVLGGFGQGVAGAGLDTLARDPAEVKPKVGTAQKSGLSGLAGKRGETTPNVETPSESQYTPSPATVQAMLKRQTLDPKTRPELTIKTPVDDIYDKLLDAGVSMDEEKIGQLFRAWDGKAENKEKLQQVARDIQDVHLLTAPKKAKPLVEEMAERGQKRKEFDAQISTREKEIEGRMKAMEEAPEGTRLRLQAEIREIQGELDQLNNQRHLELGVSQPVLPTKGQNAPVIPRLLPGIGETGVLPPSNPTGPAIPMGQGTIPTRPGTITPEGFVPSEAEKALQGYRAQQEGENSGPFGDSTVRYSGIDPVRTLKRIFKQDETVQDGPARGLISPRPRGTLYRPEPAFTPKERAENLSKFMEGSVVLDKNFQPKELYHVTRRDIGRDMFNVDASNDELGTHFGTLETINNLRHLRKTVVQQPDAQIYPVYLSIKNPLRLPDMFPMGEVHSRDIPNLASKLDTLGVPKNARDIVIDYVQRANEGTAENASELRRSLQNLGYDGVVYDNAAEGGGDSWIAFDPRQIKSATGNSGAFDPKNPQLLYSGIPPETIKNIGKALGIENLSPNFFYHLAKSVTSDMATRGASGGYLKYVFDARLPAERNRVGAMLTEEAKGLKRLYESPEGKRWINDRANNQDWDMSGLSGEILDLAERHKAFIEEIPKIIKSRGLKIQGIDENGNIAPRDIKELPGYFPFDLSPAAIRALGKEGPERDAIRKDWHEAWAKKFGPGHEVAADKALENMFSHTAKSGLGAEPMFGPVMLPHGVTLPESMRGKVPSDSMARYINRVAQHLGWAEEVQYDPVMRRALGITVDPAGKKTDTTDPVKWSDVPEAWAYAVREGKRVRAKWAMNEDPNVAPDRPIETFLDGKLLDAYRSTYQQNNSPSPTWQAGSSLASAIIMQAWSGARDVASAVVGSTAYTGPIQTVQSIFKGLVSPLDFVKTAVNSGSMQGDTMAQEKIDMDKLERGKVIARVLQSAARKVRQVSGRAALDQWGKGLFYDSVYSLVMSGKGDHLVKEFGPEFSDMPLEEKARITANRLTERLANTSTASNISIGMLPQSGSVQSIGLGLMRWPQSQWNNFSEDVINGFLNGNSKEGLKRFLTWTAGSVVAGGVLDAVADWLWERKTPYLKWGELFRVIGDDKISNEKKAKEFLYTTTAQMQAIGAMGTVGDVMIAPAAKQWAGARTMGNITDLQYPAAITGMDALDLAASFGNAVVNKRADGWDLLEFVGELAKLNQNVKVGKAMMETQGILPKSPKRGVRDQEVYERVLGKKTQDGRPIGPLSGRVLPVFNDPFAFSKQALKEGDLGKYKGFLKAKKKSDELPVLRKWSQGREYYDELDRIIGESEARKRREGDKKMDQKVREKNREIREVSRR